MWIDDGDGFSENQGDCDDSTGDINPNSNRLEVCYTTVDYNCDGQIGRSLTGQISVAEADLTLVGRKNYAVGKVAHGGDFDRDGYDDILVGALYGATFGGAVYLIWGEENLVGTVDLSSEATYHVDGLDLYDQMGEIVTSGDFNGDGDLDIAMGATGFDISSTSKDHGAVYSLAGPFEDTTGQLSPPVAVGVGAEDQFGIALITLGDLDGDGREEQLTGAPNNADEDGAVYILSGDERIISLTPAAAEERVGQSLAAGDLNGDGYLDIVVGAPQMTAPFLDEAGGEVDIQVGGVYILFGPIDLDATLSLTSATRLVGVQQGENAGLSVASGGDLNGDGLSDLLIGATGYGTSDLPGSGRVFVLFGRSEGWSGDLSLESQSDAILLGSESYERAGTALAFAGDVDRDGLVDFLVGAPFRDISTGAAYLLFGSEELGGTHTLGTGSDIQILGITQESYAGFDLASAGDVNADGCADFMVGAYADDFADDFAGAAYLIYGTGR